MNIYYVTVILHQLNKGVFLKSISLNLTGGVSTKVILT